MNYYLYYNEETYGPYSLQELQGFYESGEMTAEDYICEEGASEWILASEVIFAPRRPVRHKKKTHRLEAKSRKEQPTPTAKTQPNFKPLYLLALIPAFILISLLGLFLFNRPLQSQASEVIKSDPRNKGIEISSHYKNYVNSKVLIFNLKEVGPKNSVADVFRVLLQYARKVSDREFDKVLLCSKGEVKFTLRGDFFQKTGKEYGDQNPVYTMRTFPENLYRPDGDKAFGSWQGGLLGVTGKQLEDFTEFHKKWYIEDMVQ